MSPHLCLNCTGSFPPLSDLIWLASVLSSQFSFSFPSSRSPAPSSSSTAKQQPAMRSKSRTSCRHSWLRRASSRTRSNSEYFCLIFLPLCSLARYSSPWALSQHAPRIPLRVQPFMQFTIQLMMSFSYQICVIGVWVVLGLSLQVLPSWSISSGWGVLLGWCRVRSTSCPGLACDRVLARCTGLTEYLLVSLWGSGVVSGSWWGHKSTCAYFYSCCLLLMLLTICCSTFFYALSICMVQQLTSECEMG